MFELTFEFNSGKIGKLQRFWQKFELNGTVFELTGPHLYIFFWEQVAFGSFMIIKPSLSRIHWHLFTECYDIILDAMTLFGRHLDITTSRRNVQGFQKLFAIQE